MESSLLIVLMKIQGGIMSDQSKATHPPLSMSEFNEDLEKESAEFYAKFQGTKFEKNVFDSEQHFLDELKTHAPKLYEKLKKSNFKFRLDDKIKQDFAELVKDTEETLKKLNEL